MPSSDEGSVAQSRSSKSASDYSGYPKRVEVTNEGGVNSRRRESYFPQPSFRATRIDRDDSTGIISPSDLRRPREQPHVKVVGQAPEVPSAHTTDTHNINPLHNAPTTVVSPVPFQPNSAASISNQMPNIQPAKPTVTQSYTKDASAQESSSNEEADEISARESAFIDQFLAERSVRASAFTKKFLADNPQYHDPDLRDQTSTDTWRQTALERRSSRGLMARPETKPSPIAKLRDEPTNITTSPGSEAIEMSSPKVAGEALEVKGVEATTTDADNVVQQEPSTSVAKPRTEDSTRSPKYTSKILEQLPKDDIDFLSVADLRASMAAKRSKLLNGAQSTERGKREKLEESFKDTHKNHQEIDSMLQAKVINDQLIRRLEREMRHTQESHESMKTEAKEQHDNENPVTEAPIESSIDRMKKWLEQGSAIISSHFWQDPTEETDAKKTKLFFDKVMTRIRKGRVAMRQVAEDLETDVPATRPLLKRLRNDEDMLDAAIQALRLRSETGKPQALTPRKLKAIQALRLKFQDTDRELEAAYKTLHDLGNTDAAEGASFAFKRRLSLASKISHKSASLTRYLIWSIQARLEDTEVDQSRLVHYKAVANSLLTLRDTQMAVAQLVDRAMLIYGVVPDSFENFEVAGQSHGVGLSFDAAKLGGQKRSSISSDDKSKIRANIAANERLAHEVEAQKSAMRGLSDDGYARLPKPAPRKTFDERSPLAHSLFRPFGPVLESLGKETSGDSEVAKATEDAKKKLNDANLVAEIRQAYEDTYGPITVDHRQLADVAEEVKQGREKEVKRFEMLKEDPASDTPVAISTNEATEEKLVDVPEAVTAPPVDSQKQLPAIVSEVTTTKTKTSQTVPTAAVGDESVSVHAGAVAAEESTPSAIAAELNSPSAQSISETSSNKIPPSSTVNLPTHYTILIHDPQTDNLSITTSTTGPPRDTSPALPLHQALSTLAMPAKFIPYITEGLEVITAKKDMIVLRDALDYTSSTRSFETVKAPSFTTLSEPLATERGSVNPVDGTARLSPTGYVGPDESPEQLETEFEQRREAAGKVRSEESQRQEREQEKKESRGRKRGGGAGSVAKTAIWAAAVCYVVGVFGEIATGPFKG